MTYMSAFEQVLNLLFFFAPKLIKRCIAIRYSVYIYRNMVKVVGRETHFVSEIFIFTIDKRAII